MSDQIAIRVLRSGEEIEGIRDVWIRWNRHPHSDVDSFLDVESLSAGFVRPHVLVLDRDGQPDALLIAKLVRVRITDLPASRGIPLRPHVRVLRVLNDGLLGDASAANCIAFVQEMMSALRLREADLVHWGCLRTDCPLFDFAQSTPNFFSRDPLPSRIAHWTMDLAGSLEEIAARWSAKSRNTLKRQARQLLCSCSGEVTIKCFRQSAELGEMMRDVEAVAKNTWQRVSGGGFVDNTETRRRFAFEAKQGWLVAYVLYLAGTPSAFCIGTLYDASFFLNLLGYDPAHASHSPGTYLLFRVFDDLCRNAVTQFDFRPGEEEYKKRFGTRCREEAFVYMFAPTFKGVALKLCWAAAGLAGALAMSLRRRIGFLKKLYVL
jgi:hypothetical protein